MDELLGTMDRTMSYPGDEAEGPRGRAGGMKSCALPEHWLESRELEDSARLSLLEAELNVSGG
jgi:hypothetical protein